MATVGRLVAVVQANTGQFSRGMTMAEKRTKSFSRRLGTITKAVGAFGIAAAAAAAAGLSVLVRGQLKAIDATAKMSRNLGLATEELIGFQHAASITGVTATELETAFRRMEKNISDATLGLTTAQRAFDALGLSAEMLQGLTTAEQFRTIAEAFRGIEDQATRARVAQDLFGRSGIKLINTLNLGAEGLLEMQREAERLGITFDSIDAAQVEEANDAITRLRAVLTGLAQRITIDLAPAIQAVADLLTEAGVAGVGAAQDTTRELGPLARTVGAIGDGIQFLQVAWKGFKLAVLNGAAAIIGSFVDVIRGITAIADKFGLEVGRVAATLDALVVATAQTVAQAGQEFDEASAKFINDRFSDQIQRNLDEIVKRIEEQENAFDESTESAKELEDVTEKIADNIEDISTMEPQLEAADAREPRRSDFRQASLSRMALDSPLGRGGKGIKTFLAEQDARILEAINEKLDKIDIAGLQIRLN